MVFLPPKTTSKVCVCVSLAFLLLRGHPPIMPRFPGVPQGLGSFGVHHHVVHARTLAPCTLLAGSGLHAAAAALRRATFLVVQIHTHTLFIVNFINKLQEKNFRIKPQKTAKDKADILAYE